MHIHTPHTHTHAPHTQTTHTPPKTYHTHTVHIHHTCIQHMYTPHTHRLHNIHTRTRIHTITHTPRTTQHTTHTHNIYIQHAHHKYHTTNIYTQHNTSRTTSHTYAHNTPYTYTICIRIVSKGSRNVHFNNHPEMQEWSLPDEPDFKPLNYLTGEKGLRIIREMRVSPVSAWAGPSLKSHQGPTPARLVTWGSSLRALKPPAGVQSCRTSCGRSSCGS